MKGGVITADGSAKFLDRHAGENVRNVSTGGSKKKPTWGVQGGVLIWGTSGSESGVGVASQETEASPEGETQGEQLFLG